VGRTEPAPFNAPNRLRIHYSPPPPRDTCTRTHTTKEVGGRSSLGPADAVGAVRLMPLLPGDAPSPSQANYFFKGTNSNNNPLYPEPGPRAPLVGFFASFVVKRPCPGPPMSLALPVRGSGSCSSLCCTLPQCTGGAWQLHDPKLHSPMDIMISVHSPIDMISSAMSHGPVGRSHRW
jgi:hypothetical protein